MKTNNILALSLLLFAVLFSNCDLDCIKGEGKFVTETLNVRDFDGINLDISADITFIQGDNQKVMITGQRNIIDRIETRVTNDIWRIDLTNDCYRGIDLEFEITVPDLRSVEIDGSGKVYIEDFENQRNLYLDIDGSGKIELNDFEGLNVLLMEIDGSGKIICNRHVDSIREIDIDIQGSGDFLGFRLETEICDIDIDGSGRAEVNVTDQLKIRIDGSGGVYYKGDPVIDKRIDGSGKVVNSN